MFNGFQPWHLLLILAAVVLIFGAKKLPEAARGIGRSMRILKSEVSAMHEDDAVRKGDTPEASAANPAAAATTTPMVSAPAAAALPTAAPTVAVPPATTPVQVPVPVTPVAAAPEPAAAPAVVQATTIDGKPAVIINGVPTLIDNQAT